MNTPRILMVDDDSDALLLLTRILGQAGFSNVRATPDSRELIALYQELQPDLILLDLMMPHLSGLDLLVQLQTLIPEGSFLPIVMLTADTSPTSRRDALRRGVHDFLSKPFDPAEVVLRIKNLLKTRALHLDLKEQRQHLQEVSMRLLEAQESERRRVAHELHDEIGQLLTVVKINLQCNQRRPAISAVPEDVASIEDSISAIDHAIGRVRDLSFDLRPAMLDTFGLIETLEWCLEKAAAHSPLEVHFKHDEFEARLPVALETACFRIVQEALTNAMRHANACRFDVQLRKGDGKLELIIQDDGCGFDSESAHHRAVGGASLGLLGMEERAELAGGHLEIESKGGKGTTIRAAFPFNAPTAAALTTAAVLTKLHSSNGEGGNEASQEKASPALGDRA